MLSVLRAVRRLAFLPALALIAGCTGTQFAAAPSAPARQGAGEPAQQDVGRLLQEMNNLAKSNEVIRQMTEERLTRMSADLNGRVESTTTQSENARASLQLRLDDLLREMRQIQGKLEENAAVLANLQARTDTAQVQLGTAMRRLQAVEQRVQAGGQDAHAGQAKLEESVAVLNGLQRRVDGTDGQLRAALKRLEALEQQGRAAASASAPAAAPGGSASEPSAPPAAAARRAPSPGSTPASDQSAEELYRSAFGNYTRGSYEEAIGAFRTYLASYPKTSLAPSAQYWLAESYYSQNNYPEAIKGFGELLRAYPNSDKAPSALFRQGEVYLQLNDTKQAAAALCAVISKYPKSREAEMAKEHVTCGG